MKLIEKIFTDNFYISIIKKNQRHLRSIHLFIKM